MINMFAYNQKLRYIDLSKYSIQICEIMASIFRFVDLS